MLIETFHDDESSALNKLQPQQQRNLTPAKTLDMQQEIKSEQQSAAAKNESNQVQQLQDNVTQNAPRIPFLARMTPSPYAADQTAVSSQGQAAQNQGLTVATPQSAYRAQLEQMARAVAEYQQMQTLQSEQGQKSLSEKLKGAYKSPYSQPRLKNELPPTMNPWGQAPPSSYNLADAGQGFAQGLGYHIVQAHSTTESQQPIVHQGYGFSSPPQPNAC